MLAAGVLVVPAAVLTTSEDGGSATVRIKLTKQPADDVTIPLSSSNASEGTISQSQVAFTPLNWNVFQAVRVTGQPDGVKDGVKTYRVVTGAAVSNDPLYSGRAVADAIVRNKDSTTLVAKIKVAPLTGQTSELGRTASFKMVLGYKPIADVVIPLSSTKPSAGTPNVSTVTFTTANWNVPQTVIVTGQDDGISSGDVRYIIATAPAVSIDPLYANMNAVDVRLVNRHNTDLGQFGSGVRGGSYAGMWSGTLTRVAYGTVAVGGSLGIAFNPFGGVTARFYGVNYLGLIHLPVTPIYGAVTSVNSVGVGTVRFGVSNGNAVRFLGTGTVALFKNSPYAVAKGGWTYRSNGVSAKGTWIVIMN